MHAWLMVIHMHIPLSLLINRNSLIDLINHIHLPTGIFYYLYFKCDIAPPAFSAPWVDIILPSKDYTEKADAAETLHCEFMIEFPVLA